MIITVLIQFLSKLESECYILSFQFSYQLYLLRGCTFFLHYDNFFKTIIHSVIIFKMIIPLYKKNIVKKKKTCFWEREIISSIKVFFFDRKKIKEKREYTLGQVWFGIYRVRTWPDIKYLNLNKKIHVQTRFNPIYITWTRLKIKYIVNICNEIIIYILIENILYFLKIFYNNNKLCKKCN